MTEKFLDQPILFMLNNVYLVYIIFLSLISRHDLSMLVESESKEEAIHLRKSKFPLSKFCSNTKIKLLFVLYCISYEVSKIRLYSSMNSILFPAYKSLT